MKFRVQSSMIKDWDYNCRNHTLTITFQNDSRYAYFNVRPKDIKEVVTAPSVGRAFNRIIKTKYDYKRFD